MPATATEPRERPAVLVAGLGSVGARHLRNLRALGCERLGAYRVRRAVPPGDTDLAGVRVHTDLDEALRAGYDAVVVANPTSLHVPTALAALHAGLDAYVEKPVSHTLDGLPELMTAAREGGRIVAVGCQLRFHPHVEAIASWLARGAIGRPLSVRAEAGEFLPDWHPWEDYRASYAGRRELGGGVLVTFIHEVDVLQSLFGTLRPLAATGGRSGALDVDVEDHVEALLTDARGTAVSLHLDYLARPPTRAIRVLGTTGAIEWDYHAGRASLRDGGKEVESLDVPAGWTRNDLFVAAMRDFLDAVRSRGRPRVTLDEGVSALETTLAIHRAMSHEGNDDAG